MNGPRIIIDPALEIPVRRQILDQLRAALVEKALRPGAELPSVRRLATDLGVHFNTVAEAYRLLAEEGWLEVAHGRTARVRAREKPGAPDAQALDKFRQRLRHLVAEMRSGGLSAACIARELTSAGEGIK